MTHHQLINKSTGHLKLTDHTTTYTPTHHQPFDQPPTYLLPTDQLTDHTPIPD